MKILFLRIYNELKTKEFFEYLMQVLVQPSKFLAEQLMQVGRRQWPARYLGVICDAISLCSKIKYIESGRSWGCLRPIFQVWARTRRRWQRRRRITTSSSTSPTAMAVASTIVSSTLLPSQRRRGSLLMPPTPMPCFPPFTAIKV